ncbi:Uncharacterised protein [Vibrio cholerae]|nr:Uncharacterised protein [Vibrio cholerae]
MGSLFTLLSPGKSCNLRVTTKMAMPYWARKSTPW